jgi:broad specificity phosphatase PhoE
MATRYLYLVRHGEAVLDETALSENGRQQADLLGRRLASRPISVVHHGPLPRAAQTARLIGEHLSGAIVTVTEAAGDYVPYVPDGDELPSDCADHVLGFLAQFTAEERERGRVLAGQALGQFTGPVPGEEVRHEVVVTHNFLIGWLMRHAMGAPGWRWLGLNHGNAALTVIRYAPARLPSVLIYNDVRHLPEELRWTGFPSEMRI